MISFEYRHMGETGAEFSIHKFNPVTGFPENEQSRAFALETVKNALILTQERFSKVVGGKTNKCFVAIEGIGGSYAFGKPRVGLFPKNITYREANDIEHQKAHVGELLAYSSGREQFQPSDIDMFVSFDNPRHKVTIGDAWYMQIRINKELEKIFNETRVLINATDFFPPKLKIKPLADVLKRIDSL